MPIYEVICHECRFSGELLVLKPDDPLVCPACGSRGARKLMSTPSSLTGRTAPSLPGAGDTGCCGRNPLEASCRGAGSCCGKTG